MKRSTETVIIICIALFGVFHVPSLLIAKAPPNPRLVHAQTQGGISVQIEKITIERVFNEAAWLQRHGGANWKQKLSDAEVRRLLPAKAVTFFVSVTGKAKGFGPTKVDFPNHQTTNSIMGLKVSGPPNWQPRLPTLSVDLKATGMELWHVVDAETQIKDLFPATMEVQVTAESGQKLTFVFEKIEF